MEKQEIESRFLATMKNGKGVDLKLFARNNSLNFLDVFAIARRLRKSGQIVEIERNGRTTYFLSN